MVKKIRKYIEMPFRKKTLKRNSCSRYASNTELPTHIQHICFKQFLLTSNTKLFVSGPLASTSSFWFLFRNLNLFPSAVNVFGPKLARNES